MAAEYLPLPIPGAPVVVVVEARLPDTHDLGMAGQGNDPGGVLIGFVRRLMGVNANRTPDILETTGDGEDALELGEPGADRDHPAHPCGPRSGHDLVQLRREFREVEVAVAVHQHGVLASGLSHSAASTNRGKTPSGFGSARPAGSICSRSAKR